MRGPPSCAIRCPLPVSCCHSRVCLRSPLSGRCWPTRSLSCTTLDSTREDRSRCPRPRAFGTPGEVHGANPAADRGVLLSNPAVARLWTVDASVGCRSSEGRTGSVGGVPQQVHPASDSATQPLETASLPLLPAHHRSRLLPQDGASARLIPHPAPSPDLL